MSSGAVSVQFKHENDPFYVKNDLKVTFSTGNPPRKTPHHAKKERVGGAVAPKDEAAGEEPKVAISPADANKLAKMVRRGLDDSKLVLEMQGLSPFSSHYSAATFEELNLNPDLLRGIYALGYNKPSYIQEVTLPVLLANPPANMIAQSQSGTGKTAAFALAMLSRVDMTRRCPQVLCLSPTFELAVQTGEQVRKMAQFCPGIEMMYALRGVMLQRTDKVCAHIIIGTPGKVLDWALKLRVLDMRTIAVFVLDEADTMIATQGHHDQCIRIRKELPTQCQMMFFSATYDSEVREFAKYIVPNAIIIKLKREVEMLANIKQYYVRCNNLESKYQAIQNIYGIITVGQAIMFCRTRSTAAWLSAKLVADGHAVGILSGELSVEQRLSVFDRFRDGLEKVLITTDVMSRGIDVEQVTIVVNFDMPVREEDGQADCETYLHRIGRTGRFGKSGLAINLVDSEKAMQVCRDIEAHFGKRIAPLNADDCEEIGQMQPEDGEL